MNPQTGLYDVDYPGGGDKNKKKDLSVLPMQRVMKMLLFKVR